MAAAICPELTFVLEKYFFEKIPLKCDLQNGKALSGVRKKKSEGFCSRLVVRKREENSNYHGVPRHRNQFETFFRKKKINSVT